MLIIGYGVAALIVLVLLIVFNVRTTSKRDRSPGKGRAESAPASDVSAEPAAVDRMSDQESSGASRAETAGVGDRGYREAIRRMKTATEAGKQYAKPDANPEAANPSTDAGYREAMRSLRKTSQKQDEHPR